MALPTEKLYNILYIVLLALAIVFLVWPPATKTIEILTYILLVALAIVGFFYVKIAPMELTKKLSIMSAVVLYIVLLVIYIITMSINVPLLLTALVLTLLGLR